MKTIQSGTEITFTKTGDKHTLTQTDTGFDVKLVKLSKNIPSEPYSFQELIDLFEAGDITFKGFEEGDAALVKSQLMNYIYNSGLKSKIEDLTQAQKRIEELTALNNQLQEAGQQHSETIQDLKNDVQDLKNDAQELRDTNEALTAENSKLILKIEELNKALEAMGEEV